MLHGQTILISGGSGSFGTAFIRALLKMPQGPARIISVSRNASKRYELEQAFPDPRLRVVPGDVRLLDDLEAAVEGSRVDVICHAAAEKHIGTGERFGHYVRSTNCDGAMNVIELARRHMIPRVLALSTDKACNPINVYGDTKSYAEALFVRADGLVPRSRFSLVRYGNVVGSSGSVIPLFIKQRREGKLTITDRRMSRYFMALSDDADIQVYQEPGRAKVLSAVGFVLWALEHMRGGEIFVPRLPSATIQNLADEIGRGAEIEEIGIRPGEKLHEDLISTSEADRCWDTGEQIYAVLPEWRQPLAGWVKVPQGFSYNSGQSPQALKYEVGAAA